MHKVLEHVYSSSILCLHKYSVTNETSPNVDSVHQRDKMAPDTLSEQSVH